MIVVALGNLPAGIKNGDLSMYTVYDNIEQGEFAMVSRHRTLHRAGKAYQSRHSGNLRRVIDDCGQDVTSEACDAVNAINEPR